MSIASYFFYSVYFIKRGCLSTTSYVYFLYSCLNWQFAHASVFRFLPNAPPTNPTGPNKIAPAAAFPPLKPFLSSPTIFQPFSSLHIGHFFGAFFIIYSLLLV